MEELTRRRFLKMSGLVIGSAALSGCRVEAGPRGEVNLNQGDWVRWESRGAFGYNDDSRKLLRGPQIGEGRVLEVKQYKDNFWVRVIYDPQRGGIAWHTAETLDKRVFDDQGQSLWTEVVVKRPGEE